MTDRIRMKTKSRQSNSKHCGFIWTIQGKWWWSVSSRGLQWLHSYSLISCSSHDPSLCLAPLVAVGFSQKFVHDSVIPEILGSLLHLWLHSHNYICWPVRDSLPRLPGLTLKSEWNTPWPHSFCILLDQCTCDAWMQPRSSRSTATIRGLLNDDYSDLPLHPCMAEHGKMNLRERIL